TSTVDQRHSTVLGDQRISDQKELRWIRLGERAIRPVEDRGHLASTERHLPRFARALVHDQEPLILEPSNRRDNARAVPGLAVRVGIRRARCGAPWSGG